MMILRFLGRVEMWQMRGFAFVLAMLVYGMFGSPTPEDLGWVEGVVGLFLLFVIGVDGVLFVVKAKRDGAFWRQAGQVFIVYGVIAGFVMAVIGGNDLRLIVRDVIPFLFLALPLFLYPFFRRYRGHAGFILVAVCGVGVLFSARVVWGVDADSLYYLGNSPLVLFAVLVGVGFGIMRLSAGLGGRSLVVAAGLFGMAGFVALPLLMTLQRASLAYLAVFVVVVLGIAFWRAPRRVVFLLAVFFVPAIWVVLQVSRDVLGDLGRKTAAYGANMRVEEWGAVWDAITVSPMHFLFGHGWGAVFESPAVADISVNFTHSLLSSVLLKIGVLGFGLCVFYLYALAREGGTVLRGHAVLALALAGPIVIDVLFYAAYKSLDFGIILAVIVLYSQGIERFVANSGETV